MRTTVNKWKKVLGGVLHSMVLAIPDDKVLCSVLHDMLRNKYDQGILVRLSVIVHEILIDFRWLALDLARRPTRIAYLVPTKVPSNLGAQDASGNGMGGVHCVSLPDIGVQPVLW
jgi:hypothetical protein